MLVAPSGKTYLGAVYECGLLRCDPAQSCRPLVTFRRNVIHPFSGQSYYCFTLKMEATGSLETFVMIYKVTSYHVPKDIDLHLRFEALRILVGIY
jgi:hypothetical protein